jgi:hypothetical protein
MGLTLFQRMRFYCVFKINPQIYYSKEGKLPYRKKIQLILNMLIPTTLAQI